MSSSKCARCEQTVYPVEGLRCLDKIWHKGCFKCQECGMTLNMKNYKGFEKKPYCNAHCPQAKATTVADTPEIRRLAENTRIQSQAKYHEDFEKSKGKGFTAIADDPETLRIKETSKIISNVAYHGELERKKQMEERRGKGEPDDQEDGGNNNNNGHNHNNHYNSARVQYNNAAQYNQDTELNSNQGQHYHNNISQHQYQIQNQRQSQPIQLSQKNNHSKHHQQQQQQPQIHTIHHQPYLQEHKGQVMTNRQSQIIDGPIQQQSQQKHIQQQYPNIHTNQQHILHQQQLQHQQQQILMLQQQQRQINETSLPLNRQPQKQLNNSQQQMIKHQMINSQANAQQLQQHMKYLSLNDGLPHQQSSAPFIRPPHLLNQIQMNQIPANGQKIITNTALVTGPQSAQHHMIPGYNQHQLAHMNGVVMPKQHCINPQQQRHMIHPSQIQSMNQGGQIRSHVQQPVQQPIPHQPQMPRRVFRAMYDYVANDVDEVSFFENDILIDCVNVDRNWLIGKVARSGQTGMLPANYVAELPSQ